MTVMFQEGRGPVSQKAEKPAGALAPPTRRPFVRRRFLIVLLPLMLLAILILAATPIPCGNTTEARRAEGEQMLGSMKTTLRARHASGKDPVPKLTEADIHPLELRGKYFTIRDRIDYVGEDIVVLYADPYPDDLRADELGSCTFEFSLSLKGGEAKITWDPPADR